MRRLIDQMYEDGRLQRGNEGMMMAAAEDNEGANEGMYEYEDYWDDL